MQQERAEKRKGERRVRRYRRKAVCNSSKQMGGNFLRLQNNNKRRTKREQQRRKRRKKERKEERKRERDSLCMISPDDAKWVAN